MESDMRQKGGWQPIETAPKDGTHFIGLSLDEKHHCASVKETWMAKYQEGSPGYQRWLDGEIPRNIGWEYVDRNMALNWRPTHWMPLLDPSKT